VRRIEVHAVNSNGEEVLRTVFSPSDWYENEHPTIDSDDARRRLGIAIIRGKRFDRTGHLVLQWRATYASNGEIRELMDWHGDGTMDLRRWTADGADEHIRLSSWELPPD
jgi:hypothetical protein